MANNITIKGNKFSGLIYISDYKDPKKVYYKYNSTLFNNIMVKRVKITYKSEEILLGVYCYILEYIQQLNTVLITLERVGYIISSAKLQFYKPKIAIIGYLCNSNRLLKALKYNRYITKTGTKGKKEYIQRYQYNISSLDSIKQLKKNIQESVLSVKSTYLGERRRLYI